MWNFNENNKHIKAHMYDLTYGQRNSLAPATAVSGSKLPSTAAFAKARSIKASPEATADIIGSQQPLLNHSLQWSKNVTPSQSRPNMVINVESNTSQQALQHASNETFSIQKQYPSTFTAARCFNRNNDGVAENTIGLLGTGRERESSTCRDTAGSVSGVSFNKLRHSIMN